MTMNIQVRKRLSAFIASGVALIGLAAFGKDLDPEMVEIISTRLVAVLAIYIGGQSVSDTAKEWRNNKPSDSNP